MGSTTRVSYTDYSRKTYKSTEKYCPSLPCTSLIAFRHSWSRSGSCKVLRCLHELCMLLFRLAWADCGGQMTDSLVMCHEIITYAQKWDQWMFLTALVTEGKGREARTLKLAGPADPAASDVVETAVYADTLIFRMSACAVSC